MALRSTPNQLEPGAGRQRFQPPSPQKENSKAAPPHYGIGSQRDGVLGAHQENLLLSTLLLDFFLFWLLFPHCSRKS